MMTVEQLAEKLKNIENSRLHLKDKVATLETKIDSLQGAVNDINEIKKTLNELVSELRGGKDNELRHHDPLFTEVAKNTALRERATQTDLFSEAKNFDSWGYKNDPTHVFLYHHKSILWIRKNIGFTSVKIDGRLIVFEK